jgi:hypothetical protein
MKFRFTQLIVFCLTFCLGMLVVCILAKRTFTVPETGVDEIQPNSVTAEEPTGIAPARPTEISNDSSEDVRIEQFSDAKQIGRRGKNKIEVRCYGSGTKRFAEIKFFTRSEYGAWFQVQSFNFDKDEVTDCNPVIEDYNNDGFYDFTYQSNVAARGANEVRKLFIYNQKQDELLYIQNSEDYPNLAYNKKLNCVDSFRVSGTTETDFLHIEGDSLREFASVENGLERVVTVTNKRGESRVLRRQKYNINDFGEAFRRFYTYNPPR